jgi:fermentation-respiration switch protein FrsA (DUF1100 family)
VTIPFALVSTLVLLVLLAAWLVAGQMARRRSPDPPASPEDYDLPFEPVTFAARDGMKLGGWLIGEGKRPTVIFCAGMFGSMDGDAHMAPPFVRAGFNVLQFDWRGHGVSDGPRSTLGLRERLDLLGAIDFVQSQGVQRIGLMGFSMGGAVALRVAAEDPRVACVVSDGGFARMENTLVGYALERTGGRGRWLFWAFARLVLGMVGVRLGESIYPAAPLPVVGQIAPRPVLFIHGEDDPFVPPPDQDALYAACGQPKQLWRVPGAGHREAYDLHPEEYIERVMLFFRAGLA